MNWKRTRDGRGFECHPYIVRQAPNSRKWHAIYRPRVRLLLSDLSSGAFGAYPTIAEAKAACEAKARGETPTQSRMSLCSGCGETLPVSRFSSSADYLAGVVSQCRCCRNSRRRELCGSVTS